MHKRNFLRGAAVAAVLGTSALAFAQGAPPIGRSITGRSAGAPKKSFPLGVFTAKN